VIPIKQNRSWSKPDNIPGLIARKKVDWSIFVYGSHIPLDFHEDFEEANQGIHVEVGTKEKFDLIIDGKTYEAILVNIDRKAVDYDTLQIRYDSNEELKEFLKKKFKTSYEYLKDKRDNEGEDSRKQHNVPDELAEYIEFYETGAPFKYELKLITASSDLAYPFNNIFNNRQEAEWSFDLLLKTCNELGINDTSDERFSITFRDMMTRINFNFYDWRVLGFSSANDKLIVSISLLRTDVNEDLEIAYDFKESNINSYYLPLDNVEEFEEKYEKLYYKTLQQIKERFKNWTRTQFRKYNVESLAKGIFDKEKMNDLLSKGLAEEELSNFHDKNIWWVNQGKTLQAEKEEGIIWAPIETSNGRSMYHWDTLKEVETGDIILHYANGSMKYVSKVLSPAVEKPMPESISNEDSNRMGRLIEVNYYKLEPEISLDKFNEQIKNLDIKKGPINVKGEVNQGYLFKFNERGLEIIQQSQPETKWPDFALVDSEFENIDVQEGLKYINQYIKSRGFTYPEGLIENFYLSLKTKPFVLLAGISGTGKTKLVKLFAEAIGCKYKLISVSPDWSDSSDLLGYKNIQGKFIPGPIIDFIKAANEDPDKIYFVCLDEMNLARVEYYFSDFLSIMETRKKAGNRVKTDKLMTERDFEKDEDKVYANLIIPDNLYLIGTVNMDETTHPFSKKVLDRANTIEFSEIYLNNYRLNGDQETDGNIETIRVNNDFLKAEFITLNDCSQEDEEVIVKVINRLEEINNILQEANLQVGYRVRDEVCFYMLNNQREGLLEDNIAFDFQMMQKILPRIQGSSEAIKKVLVQLFRIAAGRDLSREDGEIGDKAIGYVDDNNDLKYPRSAEKIAYMLKRFEEDGFTAYWL
jgi:energy-coupling factor transporter ATP-binding protein EcfA2